MVAEGKGGGHRAGRYERGGEEMEDGHVARCAERGGHEAIERLRQRRSPVVELFALGGAERNHQQHEGGHGAGDQEVVHEFPIQYGEGEGDGEHGPGHGEGEVRGHRQREGHRRAVEAGLAAGAEIADHLVERAQQKGERHAVAAGGGKEIENEGIESEQRDAQKRRGAGAEQQPRQTQRHGQVEHAAEKAGQPYGELGDAEQPRRKPDQRAVEHVVVGIVELYGFGERRGGVEVVGEGLVGGDGLRGGAVHVDRRQQHDERAGSVNPGGRRARHKAP